VTHSTAGWRSKQSGLALETERPGLWPDQLRDDSVDPDDDADDEDASDAGVVRQPVNRIYYGPPGTGKTYELAKLLKREYEQAMISVSNEEWREQLIANRIANLTWWEGVAAALHDLGGKARVVQLFEHPFIQAIAATKARNQNVRQTLWGTLQHHTIEESKTVNIKLRLAPAVFDKTAGSVWQFAGDWKEACADLIETGLCRFDRDGQDLSGWCAILWHRSAPQLRHLPPILRL